MVVKRNLFLLVKLDKKWFVCEVFFDFLDEIWEDNASCVMMSENPTNRDRSRNADVKVHFLRDLVRDGHVKLLKCAGRRTCLMILPKVCLDRNFQLPSIPRKTSIHIV